MKIGVIGAGISGLSIANLLANEHEVTVYESSNKPGGLIQCDKINGNAFHKVGGHVFNSNNPKVLEWFWTFFKKEEEFVSSKRNANIYLKNKIIKYPIENFLYQLDADILEIIIPELIECNSIKKLPLDYDNFLEYLEGNFGKTLCNLYFIPYNEKIWKTDLSLVPMSWLDGKLPMPNVSEIILANILKKEEDKMVHSSFFYPKNNGSQFIADRLAKDLNVYYNYEINSIKKVDNKIVLNNIDSFDELIYTGNIKNLVGSFLLDQIPLELKAAVNKLKFNGTTTVLCTMDNNDMSWLYLPERLSKAHRVIYTGNFSDSNNEIGSRKSCTVEFSGLVEKRDVIEQLKFIPGNLNMIGYNHQPFSYVIQDKNTRDNIKDIKRHLLSLNIHLLGRFAEWEYYNMDKAIEAAFDLANVINTKGT